MTAREDKIRLIVAELDVQVTKVEANIAGRDDGFVHVGDPVAIKFDTFPFTQYGMAKGAVRTISADSFTREDDQKKETQRLVISLLHSNRYLYRYEVKPRGKTLFARRYQVGCTKEGVDFAGGDGKPECVVSGGLGKITVSYKGQTYYVCCSGCADAFKEEPEKYIKEYEAKKKNKK